MLARIGPYLAPWLYPAARPAAGNEAVRPSPPDANGELLWPDSIRTSNKAPEIPKAPVGSSGRADWLHAPQQDAEQATASAKAQTAYEANFWAASCEIARALQASIRPRGPAHRTGPVPTGIVTLWECAMAQRSRIGKACKQPVDTSRRDPRNARMVTVTQMDKRYEPQVRAIIQRLEDASLQQADDFSLAREPWRADSGTIDTYLVQIRFLNRSGDLTPLTVTYLPVDPGLVTAPSDTKTNARQCMLHTDAPRIPELMGRAHEHACAALDASTAPPDARRRVASFMWNLYHACPSHRGSAAMTDMCANALYLARGDLPHTWPPGVVGDLEALLRSESMWITYYLENCFAPDAPHEPLRAHSIEASLRSQLATSQDR